MPTLRWVTLPAPVDLLQIASSDSSNANENRVETFGDFTYLDGTLRRQGRNAATFAVLVNEESLPVKKEVIFRWHLPGDTITEEDGVYIGHLDYLDSMFFLFLQRGVPVVQPRPLIRSIAKAYAEGNLTKVELCLRLIQARATLDEVQLVFSDPSITHLLGTFATEIGKGGAVVIFGECVETPTAEDRLHARKLSKDLQTDVFERAIRRLLLEGYDTTQTVELSETEARARALIMRRFQALGFGAQTHEWRLKVALKVAKEFAAEGLGRHNAEDRDVLKLAQQALENAVKQSTARGLNL